MISKENTVPVKEVNTAKFWVKRELESKHLPILPEHVEERLFLQGRTPWTYTYADLKVVERKASKIISFNIRALLKKEFYAFMEKHYFRFIATCIYYPETQTVKIKDITPS